MIQVRSLQMCLSPDALSIEWDFKVSPVSLATRRRQQIQSNIRQVVHSIMSFIKQPMQIGS